jgi:hypothetical protein
VCDHVHEAVLDVGIEKVSRAKRFKADLHAGDRTPDASRWSDCGQTGSPNSGRLALL